MSVDFEVIVVGAGAIGSAAAYRLARAGVRVLLLEQFEVGHNRGASHGESRIIRLSYDHPLYIKLARASYKLWSELEADSGESVLLKTGMLDFSLPGHPVMDACIESMRLEGVQHETLDGTEIMRRFPQFQLKPGMLGVFQPDAGILSPQQCVPLMVRMARRHGAEVVDQTPVTAIKVDEDGASVETLRGVYRSEKLIVSAGPWAGTLLHDLGLRLPLTVTQESYVFFRPSRPELFQPDQFPIFALYGDTPHGPDLELYGFPIFGRDGVKVAQHHTGPVTTADARSFAVPQPVVDRLRSYVREYLPAADGELIHSMTCLYTTTPDRHFVIDSLPSHPHVVIAAGFSGHGFKFAIVVGKILEELVSTGRTDYPTELFPLRRFQSAHMSR